MLITHLIMVDQLPHGIHIKSLGSDVFEIYLVGTPDIFLGVVTLIHGMYETSIYDPVVKRLNDYGALPGHYFMMDAVRNLVTYMVPLVVVKEFEAVD